MSTLRATNIKNPDSGSNNIVLDAGGGVVISGVTTASSFVGNVTGNITGNATGNFTISSGNLIVGSGYGIDFSATANSSGTMTSELLSDYEEGTFTPNLENTSGTSIAISWNTRAGAYTKIGNVVYWNMYLDVGVTNSSCTGNMRISGFPYSLKGAPTYSDGFYIGFLARVGTNLRGTTVLTAAYATSSTMDLFYLNSSGNEARVQGGSDLVAPHIHMSGFYYTP